MPADYDGTGRAQIAIYRPAGGTWIVLHADGSYTVTSWGQPGGTDIPVPADYDGRSRVQLAVYRPGTGTWFVLHADGTYTPTAWGGPGGGDVPVPSDYDGTRRAQITIYRPSTGEWFVLHDAGGYNVTTWGQSGDIPQPGDYNGDGRTDLSIYRPGAGTWYVLLSGSTARMITTWGSPGDIPTVLPYAVRAATISCPAHQNGLGQTYLDCNALGTPGNQATYTSTMAQEAAEAWPPTGSVATGSYGAAQAIIKTAPSSAAVWVYTGTLAGHVFLISAGTNPVCPSATDPAWD